MDDTPIFRTPVRPASTSSRRTILAESSEHLATPSWSSPPAGSRLVMTPQHYSSCQATSSFPSPTPSCPSSSLSSSSALQPVLIPTPKLGRFLRPLRAKLAHFRQAASGAPQAHRELVQPPTPSHRPIPRRSAVSSKSHTATTASQPFASPTAPVPVVVTYSLRKSTRSFSSSAPQAAAPPIPISQLLSSVTAHLGVGRRVSAQPTRIPTPLRPSIASIQDAYKDVVNKTWRQEGQQGVMGQRQPLPLVDLGAFKLGDLIADQCEDEDDAVDELEAVYADLPVHIRSRVLLQHATRLCIVSAHEPSILLGLAQTAFNLATRAQFVALASAAIAGDPSKVSLDVLTTVATLAAKCGRLGSVLLPFLDALTVAHVPRSTIVRFVHWGVASTELAALSEEGARWDLALPGMVAAEMVQVVLAAETAVRDAELGHLIEYAKVFVGVAAKVFAVEAEAVKSGEIETMPSAWAQRLVALADALSGTTSDRVPIAITYPIQVALLTLTASSPTRALAHIPAQLAAAIPAVPRASSSLVDDAVSDLDSHRILPPASSDNLLIFYQTTQPNFWLEAALALYSAANAHTHALAVAQYLLADMQDGEARCALEPHELAAWVRVMEMEMIEAELTVCSQSSAGPKAIAQADGRKNRSLEHAQKRQKATDEDSMAVNSADSKRDEPPRPHEGLDVVFPVPSTPYVASSLPPMTPVRLPPPPVLTPTSARNALPHDHAPWYLTPVSTHSCLPSSFAAHRDELPELTPCVTQTNMRSSRRTMTSSSTFENRQPASSRPVRHCRKRSRSHDPVEPLVHVPAAKLSRSRKSRRTLTPKSATTTLVPMSSSDDDDDDTLPSNLNRGEVNATAVGVEIVEPLSETDEPDEFLMM